MSDEARRNRKTPESDLGDEVGLLNDLQHVEDEFLVPGVIDVEFKYAEKSGLRSWEHFGPEERTDFSEAWSGELKDLLIANKLMKWKPSFRRHYLWSQKSDEEARRFYKESGRDRFVTFFFPLDTELVRVASRLTGLDEIVRAAPAPRLGRPSSPLAEPLVGASDQVATIITNPGTFDSQWYIFRCRVNQAWQKKNTLGEGLSGKGVVIADIDWGFNPYHQDLEPQIKLRRNTIDNTSIITHGNVLNHGTAVLGLAGAEVNGQGIVGVAHKANLWAIQAGTDKIENHAHWLSAIDFVCDETTTSRKTLVLEIQTLSRGNIEMSIPINKAIIDAINRGAVVCVPAGNGGRDAAIGDDGKRIPPTGSILVGATRYDQNANVRGVSNWGCRIVVYAPGDEIHDVTCDSVAIGAYTNNFGGTSGAVAKVAGVAALMLERNPNLTHHQVRDIMARSQIPVVDDSSNQIGVLIDAEQAVCEAGQLAGISC